MQHSRYEIEDSLYTHTKAWHKIYYMYISILLSQFVNSSSFRDAINTSHRVGFIRITYNYDNNIDIITIRIIIGIRAHNFFLISIILLNIYLKVDFLSTILFLTGFELDCYLWVGSGEEYELGWVQCFKIFWFFVIIVNIDNT